MNAPDVVTDHYGADTDAEDQSASVSVGIYPPGCGWTISSRNIALDADHAHIADALVRCVMGAAAQHGGVSLVAALYARMRQEVSE